MHSIVKWSFYIIGVCVLVMVLYNLLLAGDYSVIKQVSRNVEKPLAEYYYVSAYYPNVHDKDKVAQSLGISVNGNATNLKTDDVDDSASVAGYSTGWK